MYGIAATLAQPEDIVAIGVRHVPADEIDGLEPIVGLWELGHESVSPVLAALGVGVDVGRLHLGHPRGEVQLAGGVCAVPGAVKHAGQCGQVCAQALAVDAQAVVFR